MSAIDRELEGLDAHLTDGDPAGGADGLHDARGPSPEGTTPAVLDLAEDAVVLVGHDGTVTGWSPEAQRVFGKTADEVLGKHVSFGMEMGDDPRFRSLLESAPDAIVVVDSTGCMQFVNARTEELFGYAARELLGRPVELLVPERYRDRHLEHRENYAAHPRARPMGQGIKLHGRRADGREFPVEISLAPVRTEDGLLVSAAIRDTTDRLALEQAHAESEERFRSAFEHAPFGMALVDAEGTCFRVNSALCTILELHPDELIGRPLAGVMDPAYQGPWAGQFAALLDGHGSEIHVEQVWHGHRGAIWVRLQAVAVHGSDGQARYAVVQLEDISARKVAAAQLEAANKALVRQERLAALGEMSSIVSHELRNPLAAITNTLFLVRRELDATAVARIDKHLQIAERETAKAARITEDLLSFARPRTPVPVALELGQVIEEVLQILPPPPEVELTVAHGSVIAFADRVQMVQVLTNVVGNAYEAMPRGGRLSITAEHTLHDVVVTVVDTGEGFDPAVVGDLFEPFVTSKPRGTGLGLAIVKRITEAHGGDVSIESAPGAGTTVTLRLAAGTPAHVLIADDDPAVRATLGALLRHAGYLVIEADDGDVALDVLDHSYVDVVVLDLHMPRLDGCSVLARLDESPPVVVVSGDTLGPDEQALLQDRAFAVLQKPVMPDVLLSLVAQAATRSLARPERSPVGWLDPSAHR